MRRLGCFVAVVLLLGSQTAGLTQEKPKSPDGVYVVQRDGLKDKEVLPLKEGEVLVVHRHRYLKKGDDEPPRFLVVHAAPDVTLDLAGEPKPIKDGTEVTGILLQLQPKAAAALERVTRDHRGGQLAILLGGEVVTAHKVRDVIKGGAVQITSCAPGAAEYLLKQLQARPKDR